MKRAYMAEAADDDADFMQEPTGATAAETLGTSSSTSAYSAQEDQSQGAVLPEGQYWVNGGGQTFQWN